VPFSVSPSSTAVEGIDYAGITPSPLVFLPNQATETITGTLIPDPGASKTLILTLGTPTGATLGSPISNTLTIGEPQTLTWTGKGVGPQWDSSQMVNNVPVTNWVDSDNNPAVPLARGIYAFVFPGGKLKNTTNIDDVPNLTAASIEVDGTYTFNGANPLTLDGNIVANAGTTTFKMGTNLAQSAVVDITGAKGASIVFAGPVSGAGGIQKDGPGTLTFVTANNTYQGGTTLSAGALDLEAVNQLGTGPINGPSANSTVVIDPLSQPVTLTNPLNLNGGTLDVLSGRSVNIVGPVTLNANSEIDLANGASIVLNSGVADGGGGYTLKIGSYNGLGGTLTLQGSLTTTVNITAGQVILAGTFAGTGNLIVNGGTLKSNANNTFSGPIDVQTGSIIIGASPIHSAMLDNPFGTGQLTLGNDANAATLALVSQFSGNVTLGNSVVFNGGTLSVSGNLEFSGPTTLMNPISFVSVSAGSILALQGGVSSASGKQNILAGTGAGVLDLGGTLQSAIVFVRAKSNFKAIAGLSVVSSLVWDANGDVLES
jgi:autotransporter-associated beta strand protein